MQTPGPANYQINRALGRVSYSFGLKGPSCLLGTKNSPGPGAYALKKTFIRAQGGRIGTSTRGGNSRPGSPGPGAYRTDTHLAHSTVKLDAPRYGFGTQDRDKFGSFTTTLSPGPGAY